MITGEHADKTTWYELAIVDHVQHDTAPPPKSGRKAARARKAATLTIIPTSTDHRTPTETLTIYAIPNGWCDRHGNELLIVPLKTGKRPEQAITTPPPENPSTIQTPKTRKIGA